MTDAIPTAHLFRPLAAELVALLRSLAPEQWSRPTSAGAWEVRDVVAHLVDGDLRRISAERDAHLPPSPPEGFRGYHDLVEYLDRLNAQWVRAARRLSPPLLIELLELGAEHIARLVENAPPHAPALYPVAWAGDGDVPLWLDHGREYTERWHHQDQVREAVGAPPLAAKSWLRPVLEISLLALPHGYARVAARAGTSIALHVHGEAGGEWSLVRVAGAWRLEAGARADAACRVRAGDYDLARLLLHRLRDEQQAILEVEGDAALAEPLRRTRAVMV